MLGFAWLTLRQVEEALRAGRLEEAHRLLGQPSAQGHKRAWELLPVVARKFGDRGRKKLDNGDAEGAWHDLLTAEKMERSEKDVCQLRQDLTQLGLTEARTLLQAGEPGRAVEALALLRERAVRNADLQFLEEAAKGWLAARELAARGEFAQALDLVHRIKRLVPEPAPALGVLEQEIVQRQGTFGILLARLHQGVQAARWQEVVGLCEEILAAAPQHEEARKARARAWKAIEPATLVGTNQASQRLEETQPHPPAPRFLLWIDGVGGFLVCMGHQITIGQATPESNVDVPLFADLSRHHATLTRDAEGYLLEAVRPLKVNSQSVDHHLLRTGDRITLGGSCQIQFRQPVAVSTSARLDVVSGHRLPLALDAVLVMADTLILGPGTQTHVNLPDLKHPVILYRHKAGLGVRHAGPFTVDGKKVQERAVLGPAAKIVGEDFALALETVGPKWGKA